MPAWTSVETMRRMGAVMPVQEWPGWPVFDEETRAAVDRVLRSGRVNYWTGKECDAFENEFAAACGVQHAVSVANGTLALELALRALDIGPGDDVVVPATSFVATASCVVQVGARPVFADVDPHSGNITPESAEAAVTDQTKAIIAVHLAGWPCDMNGLRAYTDRKGIYLVEDCAQAHGARIDGQHVGAFGDLSAYSFCQDKIMSTGGEGGMVLTNDKELWRKVWSMKDHGKNPEKTREMAVGSGFRYLHDTFGTNARMTEMQAAIGRVQLRVLDAWVQKRRRHADEYRRRFAGSLALDLPAPGASTYHAYYKLHAIISPTHLKPGWDRDRLREAIISRGVPCFSGACPEIYLERCFQNAGLSPKEPLPQARQRGERSLMFLVHPTLSDTDVAAMIDAVGMAVEEASA